LYKIINKKKRIATIVSDALGKSLFFLPRLLKKPHNLSLEKPESILIIRTAYIGDVVMALPMLKVLKNKFPGARITFLTAKAAQPLLKNNPHVDETLIYDPFWFYKTNLAAWAGFIKKLRRRHFDLVIETRADIRDIALIVFFCNARYKISYAIGGGAWLLSHVVPYPGVTHKVDFHLNLAAYLGCPLENLDGGLYLTGPEQEQGLDILRKAGIAGDFIAVHPGSRLFLKQWPKERCARLYDHLIETYAMPVVLLGSPAETVLVETIQTAMTHAAVSLAGQLDLRRLTAVIKRARIFICNDSAPMHIAAAVGTPIVAIFGPSKSFETGPRGFCQIVEKDMPCRSACDESHCLFHQYHACMDDITQKDVMLAVEKIFKGKKN